MTIFKNILSSIVLIIFATISYGQSPLLETVCAESTEAYGVLGYEASTFIWALDSDGGVILSGDGTDTIAVQWGYDVGTYQLEVVELTSAGCLGVPVLANIPVQAPEVDLGFDFYEICDGDSALFDASGNYDEPVVYLWHDGSTRPYYVADTTQDVWVLVTDAIGCTRTDSIDFISHALPVVDLGGDTIHCDAVNPLEIDAGDFAQYDWTTNQEDYFGNPIYLYTDYIEYADTVTVVVTDDNGCQASDTLLVLACSANTLFDDMINTFTPDGDGVNDTWTILKDGNMILFPDAVLEIFDRWGRIIYRTDNVFGEPWDGTSKGREMPMDAYFFVLELNFGNFEAITGTVNLIR